MPTRGKKLARAVGTCGLIAVVGGQSACTTMKLWELTDERPVAVRQDRVGEQELEERGLTYTRDDKAGLYHVEKTRAQRVVDWSVRLSVTPATLLVDTVSLLPVLAIESFADSGDVFQSGDGGKVVPRWESDLDLDPATGMSPYGAE